MSSVTSMIDVLHEATYTRPKWTLYKRKSIPTIGGYSLEIPLWLPDKRIKVFEKTIPYLAAFEGGNMGLSSADKESLSWSWCELCGKSFSDAGALKKHSYVHQKREHICPYRSCGRRFADKERLERHFEVHTKDRPFICDFEECSKRFTTQVGLDHHTKLHQNTKNPYLCNAPHCNRRFPSLEPLRSHKQKAHADILGELQPGGHQLPLVHVLQESKLSDGILPDTDELEEMVEGDEE
jgi:hypothetical protein